MKRHDRLLALATRLSRMPTREPTERDVIVYELKNLAREISAGSKSTDAASEWLAQQTAEPKRRPRPRIIPLEVM